MARCNCTTIRGSFFPNRCDVQRYVCTRWISNSKTFWIQQPTVGTTVRTTATNLESCPLRTVASLSGWWSLSSLTRRISLPPPSPSPVRYTKNSSFKSELLANPDKFEFLLEFCGAIPKDDAQTFNQRTAVHMKSEIKGTQARHARTHSYHAHSGALSAEFELNMKIDARREANGETRFTLSHNGRADSSPSNTPGWWRLFSFFGFVSSPPTHIMCRRIFPWTAYRKQQSFSHVPSHFSRTSGPELCTQFDVLPTTRPRLENMLFLWSRENENAS